jgi:hypothetical protein
MAQFHKTPLHCRDELIDALRVLWIGRVGAFLKETWDMSRDDCEGKVFEEAQAFEELKHYLNEEY